MEITNNQQNNTGNVVGATTSIKTGERNEAKFYGANFPQLTVIGYGIINTVSGTSAVFDELAGSPITGVKHQPDNLGWTVSRTAAGQYVLTHNFGHTQYLPVLFNVSPQAGGQDISVSSMSTTAINILCRANAGGALADTNAFGYIIYGFI